MKLLEETIGIDLHDLKLGSGFLDTTSKTQVTTEKIRYIGLDQS